MSFYDGVRTDDARLNSALKSLETKNANRNKSSTPRSKRKKNTNPNNGSPKHMHSQGSMTDRDTFGRSFAFSSLFGRKRSDQSSDFSEDTDDSDTSYEDIQEDDNEENTPESAPNSSVIQARSKKSVQQKVNRVRPSVTWPREPSETDSPSKKPAGEALSSGNGAAAVSRTRSSKRHTSKKSSKESDDSTRASISKNEAARVGRTRSRKYTRTKKLPKESDDLSTVGGSVTRKRKKRSDTTPSSTGQKNDRECCPCSIAFSNRVSLGKSRSRGVTERSPCFSFRERDDDLCQSPIPAYHITGGVSRSTHRPPSVGDGFYEAEVSDRGQFRTSPLSSTTGFYSRSVSTNRREREPFDTNRGNKYTEGETGSSGSFVDATSRPSLEDKSTATPRQRSLSLNAKTCAACDCFENSLCSIEAMRRQKSVGPTYSPFSRGSSGDRRPGRNSFPRASSYGGFASASRRRSSVSSGRNSSPHFNWDARSTSGLRSRKSTSSTGPSGRRQSFGKLEISSYLSGINIPPVSKSRLLQSEISKTRDSYQQLVETFKELNPFKELSHLEKAAIVGIAMSLMEAVDSDDTDTVFAILEELRTKLQR